MLINLIDLTKKYTLKIKGILHVGAHELEELCIYHKLTIKNIFWIEAMDDKVKLMKSRFPEENIIHAIVSDKNDEEVKFHVANNGESSSILEFETHKKEHPHIHYVETRTCKTKTLEKIIEENSIDMDKINFLNLDIQGVELKALKGMKDCLKKVDYVYSEVNEKELYVGCDLIGSLDEYLKEFRFKRVETSITQYGWGDAFYIKN